MKDLQNEWTILHADIEKYERFSLVIKLFSVFICTLSMALHIDGRFTIALIFILWLQDGIWKTFQQRLEARILFIEHNLCSEAEDHNRAFELYSQWEDKRPGVVGLIKEYLVNSAKPTVVYPYALLILLVLFFLN